MFQQVDAALLDHLSSVERVVLELDQVVALQHTDIYVGTKTYDPFYM